MTAEIIVICDVKTDEQHTARSDVLLKAVSGMVTGYEDIL
jgi:hypothetical protein